MNAAIQTFRRVERVVPHALAVEDMSTSLQSICGSFEIEPMKATKGQVDGHISTLSVARYDTAVVSLNAKKVMRDARMIKRDPSDYMFLLIQAKGQCNVAQASSSQVLNQGDMYLVDSARASTFYYDGNNSRQLSIHLPRLEMIHRFGTDCTGGMGIDRDDPLSFAMQAVLAKTFDTVAENQPALMESFFSLLGNYIQCQNRLFVNKPSAILSNALQLIETRFHEPDFGPSQLAHLLGISTRKLQRVFAELGETASLRIINTRLDFAHRRLRRRGFENGAVTEAAYAAGFNDLSYFNRAFRKRYGTAPSEILAH